jgi:hypothetical protein
LPTSIHYKPVLPDRQLFGLAASRNVRSHVLSHALPYKDKP